MQKRKEESSTTTSITGPVGELNRGDYVPSENDQALPDAADLKDNGDTSTNTQQK